MELLTYYNIKHIYRKDYKAKDIIKIQDSKLQNR